MAKYQRKTKKIAIGNVPIGGDSPIAVQSMTKTSTCDIDATVKQILGLEAAGCELIRVGVKDEDSLQALPSIISQVNIPVIADIHFKAELALGAIEAGVHKLRINPGNIRDKNKRKKVVHAAKERNIPIRIGINEGSIPTEWKKRYGTDIGSAMVHAALSEIDLCEKEGFEQLVISMKGSDVMSTVSAYQRIAQLVDYPLHLGIAAAGPYQQGCIRTALCLAILLNQGIGDTLRVSLTADPISEVQVARRILHDMGLRDLPLPTILACPTCERLRLQIIELTNAVQERLNQVNSNIKIAIMGCEVNGPGEARLADLAITASEKQAIIYKHGRIVQRIPLEHAAKVFLNMLDDMI